MAANCGSRSTDLYLSGENNRLLEKWREGEQSSSKSALSCTSDEDDDDDSQLDGMSFDSNDRELAEKMMLENERRDVDNHCEPDASDILASLHSPSSYSSTGETVNKISEAAPKVDKDEDRTQRSCLKNSAIEKSTLEAFGKTDSLFPLPLSQWTHEYDDTLDMECATTDNYTTKEDESAQPAKSIHISIDVNGDMITEPSSTTYPLNAVGMPYKDRVTWKMMARASELINNSTRLFNSGPTKVSDMIRLKPHQNSRSKDDAVPPCSTDKISTVNRSTRITSRNSCPHDPGTLSQDNKNTCNFTTLNTTIRKRPYESISGAFIADNTAISLTDEVESLHERKIGATTTDFVRQQAQDARAETLIPHYHKVGNCVKSSQLQRSDADKIISRKNQLGKKKRPKKRLFQNNVNDSSPLSEASRINQNSSFSISYPSKEIVCLDNSYPLVIANDVAQLDEKDTDKANTLLPTTSATATKSTTILTTARDFGSVDQINQQTCSSNVILPLLNGYGTNHVKNVLLNQQKQVRQRNDKILPAISKVAGRAKLLLPMTRSTDVPNAKINLMCSQRRPRLYNNNDPPITLSTEIDPQKERYRINNMPDFYKEQYVTCYDRKTCKVLENVCKASQLAELLAGHAELEPVILPINDDFMLKPMHKNSSCSQSSSSREGRSSFNIRVLSALRPQNSLLRCSDSHIGKVVQVLDGIYSGRQGTITSALPTGWYTLSGLLEEENTDIFIKASNVKFATDPADHVSSLPGLDTSLLQQILHKK
jgi:hypothetical protein